MTPAFRQGNPEPRYYSFPGGSINSMGLPNLGTRPTSPSFQPFEGSGNPLLRVSPGSVPRLSRSGSGDHGCSPDLIEVNLSCPNIQGKPQIGYDVEASRSLLLELKDIVTVPMGVKLPPYSTRCTMRATARMLQDVGVDFLSVINSVGNGLVGRSGTRERVVIKPKADSAALVEP